MKKMVSSVMAVALLLMAGTAMAAGNATLTVSATVQASCSITGPGTLNFGTLDSTIPGATATANSTGISITCTNGSPYTVTSASLNSGLLSSGTDSFAYTLALPPNGTGTGVSVAYTVAGSIAANAFFGKAANVYTDTVTLSITP